MMNEADWLTYTNPVPMLEFLCGSLSFALDFSKAPTRAMYPSVATTYFLATRCGPSKRTNYASNA